MDSYLENASSEVSEENWPGRDLFGGFKPPTEKGTHDDLAQQVWGMLLDSRKRYRELEEKHRLEMEIMERKLESSTQVLTKLTKHLVFCLLDGDGTVFEPRFLKKKEKGGQDAAGELVNEIKNYVRMNSDITNFEVIVMLYYSRNGLSSRLRKSGECTSEESNAFFRGFTRALPLINVTDVAAGKEEADNKLRRHFDLFIEQPQTLFIFFGGDHDRGYANMLRGAQTIGLGDKIVVLQVHTKIVDDIAKLQLPTLSIPGLFLPEKLDKAVKAPNLQVATPPPIFQHKRHISDSLSSMASQSPRSNKGPCFYKNLLEECKIFLCPYDHETPASTKEIDLMRQTASSMACPTIKRGDSCEHEEKCPFSHSVPLS